MVGRTIFSHVKGPDLGSTPWFSPQTISVCGPFIGYGDLCEIPKKKKNLFYHYHNS